MRRTLLGIALLASPAPPALSQEPVDRVVAWRADLDYLVSEARRVHAGPARPAHGPVFSRRAEWLAARIPYLSDRQIVVEIQRLMSLLGDGHSMVYPVPTPSVPFEMLPVEVWLFEDGLFIVDALPGAEHLVGMEVTHIGGRAVDSLLLDLSGVVSRDNDIGIRAFATFYLIQPDVLEALGARRVGTAMPLAIRERSGATREVLLEAGPVRRPRRRLMPPPGSPLAPPLYQERLDRTLWFRRLADGRTVYLQFNQVADGPDGTLAALAGRLRDTLGTPGVDALIVDVRHNNGGDNTLLDPLLDAITGFAGRTPARPVYVLTSRVTFSAAQSFITRLERMVRPLFAGEPSMSSPNFTGEDNPVILPRSGVTVSIANRHWQEADPGDRRPWIAPHLAVAFVSQDWWNQRDPVLEAVLHHLAGVRR